MSKRVVVNGFGRIGRLVFRQLMEAAELEVVGINDVAPLDNLAYLLRHDSVHRPPTVAIEVAKGALVWDGTTIPFSNGRDPAALPWDDRDADIVIESTGLFTKREDAAKHLQAGADRVVVTAPAKGDVLTVCMGVNEDQFDPAQHRVVSNASCTTNCLAPIAKVIHHTFEIETGFLTTVHAATSSQSIVDAPARKWRRGRSALASIVPTTTGAAIATTEVLPDLKGSLDGMAMRVPVLTGSVVDFVVRTRTPVTAVAINDALSTAAQDKRLKGILGVTEEELVSADIIGSRYSALVDAGSTMVLGDRTAKIIAFYDNEWGYACRVADVAAHIAARI